MPAVWLQLRAELRARRRTWLVLACAVGLAAGLVLWALAGARRADSAFVRYRAFSHATDVLVGTGSVFGNQGLNFERVRRLPDVEVAVRGILPSQSVRAHSGRDVTASVAIEVSPDPANSVAIDRPKLLQGRLPDARRPDEAIADRRALEILGVGLGEPVRVRVDAGPQARRHHAMTLRIVGVRPDTSSANTTSFLTTTPAFYRAYGGQALAQAAWRNALKVRLKHGAADLPAFQRGVESIAGGRDFQFTGWDLEAAKIQSPLHLQAQALRILAALGGVAALLLLGQGLARTSELESQTNGTLLALGMSRAQLAWLAIARAAALGLAATVVALAAAVALSPLSPMGRARDYEPHPGVAVDGAVLLAGGGGVLAAVLLAGSIRAVRALGATPGAVRDAYGGRPARALARTSALLPPAIAAGVRMAVPGARSGGGTARATLAGAVLAVAVAATALTFSASLSHLLHTPGLSGITWDYANYQGSGTARDLDALRADAAIAAVAYGEEATLDVAGRRVGAAGYDAVKGDIRPTVLSGRAPVAAGEMLLGAKTFDAAHARIGERLAVRRGGRSARMTVVGRGIIPEDEWLGQGDGAVMTFGSLHRLIPGAFRSRFLIRIADGADREATLERLESTYGVPRPGLPPDVGDFGGVRKMPLVIAALVGAVAAAALARNLLTSIRRRRRELAILKALGFTRGQVGAAVGWHAATVASVAALIGVPLGIALGRWAWALFARHLGVAPEPVTQVAASASIVPLAVLLATLVGALPAWAAARTRPALALRAE